MTVPLKTASEATMWDATADDEILTDDAEIADRYSRGEGRIIIETNREKLPGFVDQLNKSEYMDLRPFYQRRPRWPVVKQSLLIESFIMNIPVPPVFLYERAYNSFEVMDGQQRITALRDFYENRFKLRGLEIWRELNGKSYHNLPPAIKAGLDRRSLSSIVVLKESTGSEEDADFLREVVFERLNTGGTDLSPQEIRNALYSSAFNDRLHDLARGDLFRKIWGLPPYEKNEIDTNPELTRNAFYQKMEDTEVILRFFALRHCEFYKRGMRGFLDMYMRRAADFPAEDVDLLANHFVETLSLAFAIYGDKVFQPFDPETGTWLGRPQKAFYDAVMVGLSRYLESAAKFVENRDAVVKATQELFVEHEKGTFTGRGNTKADVQNRIDLFAGMLAKFV